MSFTERLNPITVAVYFLSVTVISIFCTDPAMLALSLLGAFGYYISRNGSNNSSSHLFFLVLLCISAIVNPIVSHNGMTVLFVVNDTPITLEAAVYGAVSGLAIVATLYWFRAFTEIMTSDKLLYIFGKLSPKLSLILSMAIRYVSLFSEQAGRIKRAQTALGLYKDGNIIDRVRGGLRVFSVLVTWALENGITTADSMTARGYGCTRRTHFSLFSFGVRDGVALVTVLVLFFVSILCVALGAVNFEFYPTLSAQSGVAASVCRAAFGLLAFLPMIAETAEMIRWKYLRSKI